MKKQEWSLKEHFKKHNCKLQFCYKGEHDGRRTTNVWVIQNGKCYHGLAQCSKKDVYNKQKGRTIALGRAYKNYVKEATVSIPEFIKRMSSERVRNENGNESLNLKSHSVPEEPNE